MSDQSLTDKVTALETIVQTLQGRVQYLELHLGVGEDNLQWGASGGTNDPQSWQYLNQWSLGK